MKNNNSKMVLIAIALMATDSALAYQAGDWIVRAGYAAVDPRDHSSSLKIDGSALAGTGVGVDSGAALGITTSYMLTPQVGIELLVATPFKHDITAKGLGSLGVADGTKIGSTKQLPPTLSAQYYFAPAESVWQPYVGLGINYTVFFSEQLSSEAKDKLAAEHLRLGNSWGVAGEAGIDWRANKNWLVNASIWRTNIRSDASLDTALGHVKTKVTVDPWVYMVAVGYQF